MLENLVRPSILQLKAYESARSLSSTGNIFLDANESWDKESGVHRYPLPQPKALQDRFASLYCVSSDQILMGRGCDEAIDNLIRAFCEPKEEGILIFPPTYGMYSVSAAIQNVPVISVPLSFSEKGWFLSLQEILDSIRSHSIKLIFLCSPNNPTGSKFSEQDISFLCKVTEGKTLVVVDEAYQEFSFEKSAILLLKKHSNLIVLRTLSKAWALAGIRCGVAIGDAFLISMLQKVRAPYPLSQPTIDLAIQALSREGVEKMNHRVEKTKVLREEMRQCFQELPCVEEVYESWTNFLLVRFQNAKQVMNVTRQYGVVLRDRSEELGLKNCIRITVGTEEENQFLFQILKEVAAE